ncbi:MAG: ankyrin repeat domain-containing protein, partial [Gammaproteobacteria bacterium]
MERKQRYARTAYEQGQLSILNYLIEERASYLLAKQGNALTNALNDYLQDQTAVKKIWYFLIIESTEGKQHIANLLTSLAANPTLLHSTVRAILQQQAIEDVLFDICHENLALDTKCDANMSLLELAMNLKCWQVVELLALRRVSFKNESQVYASLLTLKNSEGATLIQRCIKKNRYWILPALIDNGSDLDIESQKKLQDQQGNTLLHNLCLTVFDFYHHCAANRANNYFNEKEDKLITLIRMYSLITRIVSVTPHQLTDANHIGQTPLQLLTDLPVLEMATNNTFQNILNATRESILEKAQQAQQLQQQITPERERNMGSLYNINSSNQHAFVTEILQKMLMRRDTPVPTVAWLTTQGADLTATCQLTCTYYGYTALHIAASTKNLAICKWIIEQGIDVNIKSDTDETALDKAGKAKDIVLVTYLRSQGGNSEYLDKSGQTCTLHQIIGTEELTEEENSFTETMQNRMQELLDDGADLNGINMLHNAWQGDRPIHTAFIKGNPALITWLLTRKADPMLPEGRRQENAWERLHRVSREPERVETFIKNNHAEFFKQRIEQEQQAEIKQEIKLLV